MSAIAQGRPQQITGSFDGEILGGALRQGRPQQVPGSFDGDILGCAQCAIAQGRPPQFRGSFDGGLRRITLTDVKALRPSSL